MQLPKTSEIERLAWGTDAGFYRLLPKYVVHPTSEQEIIDILTYAHKNNAAVTFRAAGTSLSGQAITNSILVVVGKKWEKYKILDNGQKIKLQPGIIGQRVNELLKPYGRKFGPDPASIKSAMVGGIIMNNASGMICGTHANSNKELISVRMILADGTILDTADTESKENFKQTHPDFIAQLQKIQQEVLDDQALTELIRKKYSIKNVTGLTICPLIDFNDPFDIMAHLLVGSEGTLAFLSEATMKTVTDFKKTASALTYFPNTETACNAVVELKKHPVSAVELFDYKALKSVKENVDNFDKLPVTTIALLVKVEADTQEELQKKITQTEDIINQFTPLAPAEFTENQAIYEKYWAIRSGIFPSVGSMRPVGTTCLIEDVAFPIDVLPQATADLQKLLEKHKYDDAVIYGHALEGNYHFIINQAFDTQESIQRYENMMNDVITLVVDKYHGSLKAEHGTGRNMAPFVEKEWGNKAFNVMKSIKQLFDPQNILNPGVIFNDDPKCHIKNLKPLPKLHPLVDKCIECGFCEVNCVTCGLALSSRQRIVIQREIAHLQQTGENPKRLKELIKSFKYIGNTACAGDGLCATSCPIKINTGEFIHIIREKEIEQSKTAQQLGKWTGKHLDTLEGTIKIGLNTVYGIRQILGDKLMTVCGNFAHNALKLPLWTPAFPKGVKAAKTTKKSDLKVVYFPSCINQSMGVSNNDPDQIPLMQKTVNLLEKAGYEVIFPNNMKKLCCGTIWESKGMPEVADQKSAELEQALLLASENGSYPILCDQSPCLYRMRHTIKNLELYEPVEFITKFLIDKLNFTPTDETITIHATCSTIKMGLKDNLINLAKLCSKNVVIPEEIGCCGFAGDKGFTHPEINRYALRKLRPQIEKNGITSGYSNSRTCEIGLNTNGGIPFMSIVYLVDRVTTAKKQ
ncbi:MAG: FAD-binding and (Fe-S)-binding domain-containing protein [Paludibacteraceae bacterium]|nr:FAD-binding and (Fe-S)-binding domain-containing protein [Paludibacteraceae bacterium]